MNRLLSLSVALLITTFVVLCVTPPLSAAKGGGHGAGHFGGGGQFGGGGSSGHSFGHSVGHSLGHIFGHRSGGRSSRIGKNPSGRGDIPAHFVAVSSFHRPMRRSVRFRNGFFESGFCDSFRFSWHNFLFPGDSDCFGGSFFFDPFLYGGFVGTDFWSDSFDNSGALPGGPDSSGESSSPSSEHSTSTAPPVLNVEQSLLYSSCSTARCTASRVIGSRVQTCITSPITVAKIACRSSASTLRKPCSSTPSAARAST